MSQRDFQGVGNVIEGEGVGELCVEHGDDMRPWREGSRLFINAMFSGKSWDEVRRN